MRNRHQLKAALERLGIELNTMLNRTAMRPLLECEELGIASIREELGEESAKYRSRFGPIVVDNGVATGVQRTSGAGPLQRNLRWAR